MLANSSLSFGVRSSSVRALRVSLLSLSASDDELLGLLALSQNREEVLLLQSHLQLQLLLELREEALACLDRVAGGLGELSEELVRLSRAGLDQLADGWHSGLQRTA